MVDELDTDCQWVEVKIDFDPITIFPSIFRSDDWIIQVFWEWKSIIAEFPNHYMFYLLVNITPYATKHQLEFLLRIVEVVIQPMGYKSQLKRSRLR